MRKTKKLHRHPDRDALAGYYHTATTEDLASPGQGGHNPRGLSLGCYVQTRSNTTQRHTSSVSPAARPAFLGSIKSQPPP